MYEHNFSQEYKRKVAAIKEISGKSLKIFALATTKWRPCKFFVKMNGNQHLMDNIFKLHKYQIYGVLKMHNMSKI